MLTYCLKRNRNTESVDSKMLKTKSGSLMLSLKCALCGSKQSRFMKEQGAKTLLTSLGLKTAMNTYPLLEDILF